MKKRIFPILLFLWVCAPLGAQTFEKVFKSPVTEGVNKIIVNDKNEILLVIEHVDNYSHLNVSFQNRNVSLVKLNEKGDEIKRRKLHAYDFIQSFDSTYEYVFANSAIYKDNKYLLNASIRNDTSGLVGTNSVYSFELNEDLDIINTKLNRRNMRDTSILMSNMKEFNSKYYGTGIFVTTRYNSSNILTDIFYSMLLSLDDSLSFSDYLLWGTRDSINLKILYDYLIDKRGQVYLFGEGNSPDGVFTTEMQLIKLDVNKNKLIHTYLNYPTLREFGEYTRLMIDNKARSFWLSDSTFLLAAYGPTDGWNSSFDFSDMHLMIYDTSLVLQKYHRVRNGKDSTLISFLYNDVLVYDSINDYYYMGASIQKGKALQEYVWGSGKIIDFNLVKFDKDLNIIFNRNYRRDKSLIFNSMAVDNKGNVIIGGTIQDLNTIYLAENDAFVLKVDSLGNYTHTTITGIPTFGKIDRLNYEFAPNPSDGKFSFIQYNLQEVYTMDLYDIKGSFINTFTFKDSDNYFDISNQQNGVYIYRLKDRMGRTASGKLIKQ